jgi:hypothetical protein
MNTEVPYLRAELRSTKPETRRPKEARNPKSERRERLSLQSEVFKVFDPRFSLSLTLKKLNERITFGFQGLDFGLLSAFGFRPSDFFQCPHEN